MNCFPLKIVTPAGIVFDGQAEALTVRTTSGELGILCGHMNCVAPLGMGRATVILDGKPRYGACIGGILSVMNGVVTLVPTSFEWAEDIDLDRVERSYSRAQAILGSKDSSQTDIALAQARLRRALVRKGVCATEA